MQRQENWTLFHFRIYDNNCFQPFKDEPTWNDAKKRQFIENVIRCSNECPKIILEQIPFSNPAESYRVRED